jgi:uncharacterized protein YqjF (DUF2071 family)
MPPLLSFLQDHPFAVQAHFERSVVLTYAVPKEDAQRLIPACLELDTFADRWAFCAVAMVRTRGLRPKGTPAFMGNDFFLIGYRIFVRYTTVAGKRLRGLYILRSETDSERMRVMGNLFTHYDYHTIDLHEEQTADRLSIRSTASDLSGAAAVHLHVQRREAGGLDH